MKATSENVDSTVFVFPDDSFAVGPGAGDPLGGVFADQEAVARTPHILAPRGGVPDRCGLCAIGAFDDVLGAIV